MWLLSIPINTNQYKSLNDKQRTKQPRHFQEPRHSEKVWQTSCINLLSARRTAKLAPKPPCYGSFERGCRRDELSIFHVSGFPSHIMWWKPCSWIATDSEAVMALMHWPHGSCARNARLHLSSCHFISHFVDVPSCANPRQSFVQVQGNWFNRLFRQGRHSTKAVMDLFSQMERPTVASPCDPTKFLSWGAERMATTQEPTTSNMPVENSWDRLVRTSLDQPWIYTNRKLYSCRKLFC